MARAFSAGRYMRRRRRILTWIAHAPAQLYPKEYPKKFNIQYRTLADSVVGRFKQSLYTLLAAVGLLLPHCLPPCRQTCCWHGPRRREKEMAISGVAGAGRVAIDPANCCWRVSCWLWAAVGGLPGGRMEASKALVAPFQKTIPMRRLSA